VWARIRLNKKFAFILSTTPAWLVEKVDHDIKLSKCVSERRIERSRDAVSFERLANFKEEECLDSARHDTQRKVFSTVPIRRGTKREGGSEDKAALLEEPFV
jgi:hypothetical protein